MILLLVGQPAGCDQESHGGKHLVKGPSQEPEGSQDSSETEDGEDHQGEDGGEVDILEDGPIFTDHFGPVEAHEPYTQMDEGQADDGKHDVRKNGCGLCRHILQNLRRRRQQ